MIKCAIVGTSPTETDIQLEDLYTGIEGRILSLLLDEYKIPKKACELFSVSKTFSPEPIEAKDKAPWVKVLVERDKDRLFKELEAYNPDRILLLGLAPFTCFFPGEKLSKNWNIWKKATLGNKIVDVLPTYSIENLTFATGKFLELRKGFEFFGKRVFTYPDPTVLVAKTPSHAIELLEDYVRWDRHKSDTNIREYDLETTGSNPRNRNMMCMGISPDENHSIIIPDTVYTDQKVKQLTYELLNDPKITLCGHNSIMFDDLWMKEEFGQDFKTDYDSMLVHYLLDERMGCQSLDYITQYLFGVPSWKHEVDKYVPKNFAWGYRDVPRGVLYKYLGYDTTFGYRIAKKLIEDINLPDNKKLLDCYKNIYVPGSKMLGEISIDGICADIEYLRDLDKQWELELSDMKTELLSYAKLQGVEEFEVTPAKMSKFLYETLDLKKYAKDILYYINPNSDEKEIYDYDSSVGSPALNEIIDKISKFKKYEKHVNFIKTYSEWSRLSKLKSTFVVANIERADHKGYLHPQLLPLASTGRLIGARGSFMNLPAHDKDGRVEKGLPSRADEITYMVKCPPGFKLLHVDYSQIELRIAALLSGDKTMKGVFQRDEDPHAATGSKIFGISIEEILSSKENKEKYRQPCKKINFGLLYGATARKLSQQINMSLEEATKLLEEYFIVYPGIKNYIDTYKNLVDTQMFVETPYGNRRRFPGIFNPRQLASAQREGCNMPIQGMASIMCWMAALKVYNSFPKEEIRLFNLVHDAAYYYVREDRLDYYLPKVIDIMEHPDGFLDYFKFPEDLPIKVDYDVSDRWGSLTV